MSAGQAAIKEEEIRPEALFSEFMRLSIADAESFFDRSKFVNISCPACGSSSPTDQSFIKHSFSYAHCGSCGTLYVDQRPDASELLRYYATSKSQKFWAEDILPRTGESRKKSILMPALTRVEELMGQFNLTPKSILDIGAANGAFLGEWQVRHPEMSISGIEPGQHAAKNCRAMGATVYEGFVEDKAIRAQAKGDLVTCFEVLEHVQDPQNFAAALFDVTAPGGCMILSCLGCDGFDIQLLWEDSRSITPPYHLNFLSAKGMKTMFEKAGFSTVTILTPGRLDVEIVKRTIDRGAMPALSRFEQLLLSKDEDTLKAFQAFLATYGLSSHVWIIAQK